MLVAPEPVLRAGSNAPTPLCLNLGQTEATRSNGSGDVTC